MTGRQNTKHLPPRGSGLGSCSKQAPISTTAPWGLGLQVCTVAVIPAGRAQAEREGPDLRAHCRLLPCGSNRAIKEQGAFSRVYHFLLLVTKESLVNTRHPGIRVAILPSHCGKSKHDRCILHEFAEI